MHPDKRKAAVALILGGMSPKEEGVEDKGGDAGLETAIEEFCDAMNKSDWKAAAVAFRSMKELAESPPESGSMKASDGDEEDYS